MIDLEERIGTALDHVAGAIAPPPFQPERPRTLTRRRRRNRRAGWAAMALVAVIGLGAALQLGAGSTANLEAVGRDDVDEDGVPLDTGPQLQWEEAPGAADLQLTDVVWSGERFVAVGGENRDQMFGSVDGRSWEPLSAGASGTGPDGLVLFGLVAGDGRLVGWGPEQADRAGAEPIAGATRIVVSDDHGTTWHDVGPLRPGTPDDDPTDYVTKADVVNTVAAAGDTVMALSTFVVWPDLSEVLVDRGLAGPDDEVVADSMEVRSDNGQVSAEYCLNPTGSIGCGDEPRASISFSAPALVDQHIGQAVTTTVWVSADGGPFEAVAELEGEAFRVVSVQGRFLALSWREGGELLASDDGRTWTPIGLEGRIFHLTTDGTEVVAAGSDDDGSLVHRSGDGGRTWSTDRSPVTIDDVVVGPRGLAMTGAVPDEDQSVVREFLEWVSGRRPGHRPVLVGWSADGTNWGWQTRTEAFGSESWAPIDVGADTAVALVWSPHNGPVESTTTTLFVADLP